MALQSSGAISFADINTELGRGANAQLDIQTAGTSFDLQASNTNWSDNVVGLSMSEFYGLDIDDVYGGNDFGS